MSFTGISSETIFLPEDISEKDLLQKIRDLNQDDCVDGIIVQLPVPEYIKERTVCNAVAPQKDVDGFHVVNVGRFCVDQMSMVPATPTGVVELIRRAGKSDTNSLNPFTPKASFLAKSTNLLHMFIVV